MSMLTNFFKKKKGQTISQEAMQTDEQKKAMEMLSSFMQTGQFGNYKAGDAYGGSLGDFEMTDAQKAAQSSLMDLITGGLPSSFTDAQNEFKSVLNTDKFDPYAKGGVYDGFSKQVMRQSQEQKDALQRDLALTGDMYSSDRAKQLGILGERTNDTLTNKLADLYSQYVDRRTNAATSLGQLGVQENAMKSNNINLATMIGDLQRELNDKKAKAMYADWTRARGEQQSQIDTAKTLFQKDVPFGVKSITAPDRPSAFMSMLGEVSPAVGSYNTHQYGYTTNQGSIADAMSSGAGEGGIMDILKKLITGGMI